MTTREALLRAILDHPDEDTPRLAYADLLDESGAPADAARAELIRLQIAVAPLPYTDRWKRAAIKRCDLLVREHRDAWLPPLPPKHRYHPHYHRGFVRYWQFDTFTDLAFGSPTPFDREPLTDVSVYLSPEEVPQVVNSPRLARIRELVLVGRDCPDESLVSFFRSSHLTGLRKLRIEDDRAGPEFLRTLATLPQYTGLEELEIEGEPIGDAGVVALAVSVTLTRLRRLRLSFCGVTPAGYSTLLTSPVLADARDLGFSGDAIRPDTATALAAALASSTQFRGLTRLALNDTALPDAVVGELARANWPELRSLSLTVEGWPVQVGNWRVTATGVRALVASPFANAVEVLSLCGNPIRDEGAALLVRFPRLRNLRLSSTGITANGLCELLAGSGAQQFELFSMSRCPLGDAGATAIAEAPWPQLHRLDLGQCRIGEAGARALLHSRTLPADLDLNLSRNPIPQPLVTALEERFPELNFIPEQPR
jgi:uncharacterized protein (TIGR02996 family)